MLSNFKDEDDDDDDDDGSKYYFPTLFELIFFVGIVCQLDVE